MRIHIAIALVGCSGTYETVVDPDRVPEDDDDGEMSAARQQFEEEVAPILRGKCAACHMSNTAGVGPKFLGATQGAYYDEIVKQPSLTGNFEPALATLLTKIITGDHYASVYTETEQASITDWLRAEALERGDGDDDGEIDPLPANDPLAEFSGCMTLDDWAVSNMGEWGNKETEEDGPCLTCHDDGMARFYASGEDTGMFAMNRYELYLIGFFTVHVDPDGTQTVVPAVNKLRRMGTGNFHPNYLTDQDGDPQFASLQQFHQLTMARKASGQCGPAEFPPPPEE